MGENDGDFTKFVARTNKPRDHAQKYRAYKNITRFFKNPFGYTYWKLATLSSQNRLRITYALLIFHLYQSFMLYLLTKMKKENMIAKWRWHIGENNRHYDSQRNKRISMIHTNWWCRDQVFRKYFDMRKKHGIEPAMSGFYHDTLYAKTLAQNTEWANIRASKSMQ